MSAAVPRMAGSNSKPAPGMVIDPLHALAPSTAFLFNEGAGKAVLDATGTSLIAATSVPGAWRSPIPNSAFPVYGPMMTFNGTTQYIQYKKNSAFEGLANQPMTLAALFRITDAGTTSNEPIGLGASSGGSVFMIQVNNAVVGRLGFSLIDNASQNAGISVDNTGVNNGNWHLVHCVSEGTGGKVWIYMDGVQRQSGAALSGTSVTLNQGRVGARGNSANASAFFNGDIAFAMAWRRALSAGEIRSHFANPFQMILPLRLLNDSLLPATFVIDRRTGNFRPASRIARGGL